MIQLNQELLQACKDAVNWIMWNECQEMKGYSDLKETLKEAIEKAGE